MASRTVARIVFNRLPEIARRLPTAAMEVVKETLEDIDRTVKAGMLSSGSGRTYVRGGRAHTASAPGQMPAVDTGQLIASLKHEIARGKYKGYYYTDNEYAAFLEYGTSRMLARPFLTPGAERARGNFLRKMKNLESRLR